MTTGPPGPPDRHPYARAAYVEALGLGRATEVEPWGTAVTLRPTPDGGGDVSGAYPLAALAAGADIDAGLDRLRTDGLVSATLVPDPLGGPSPEAYARAFPLCRPFKTHALVDPAARAYDPSRHHRERIRRGRRRCRLERVRLSDHLPEWTALYADLVARRAVTGAAAFPPAYFEALACMPQIEAFAAFVQDDLVGMTLWFAHAGVVYNHLTASSTQGYANGASFALYDAAIERFVNAGVINLGGGAGRGDDPQDGLAAFKRGFANGAVQAWLCGAVLDPARYAALSAGRETTFFPAYRG